MRLLPLDPRPGRPVRGLRFAADGRFLAAVAGRPNDPRRQLVRYDLGRSVLLPSQTDRPGRSVGDPAVGPDLRLTAELVRVSQDESYVQLTDDRGDRPEVRRLNAGHLQLLTAVGFSADGGTLFIGAARVDPGWAEPEGDTFLVARLDVANWLDAGDPDRLDEELPTADPASATCFADTGAGLLAVGTSVGTAVLCDLIGGTSPLTVQHHPGATDPPPVDAVLFSPDGRHLVTRSAGTLAVWDALTGRELARPAGRGPFADCAFTPDGRSLLAVGLDTGVSRFAAPRYALAERLEFGHGALHSVAVSPDGLTAAAGTGGGTAVLWDL